jgi:hypothetical protein
MKRKPVPKDGAMAVASPVPPIMGEGSVSRVTDQSLLHQEECQGPGTIIFFFLNSLIHIQYNKLYVFKVYNWIYFDICLHL